MYSVQAKIPDIQIQAAFKALYMVHLLEFLKRAATERNALLRVGRKTFD